MYLLSCLWIIPFLCIRWAYLYLLDWLIIFIIFTLLKLSSIFSCSSMVWRSFEPYLFLPFIFIMWIIPVLSWSLILTSKVMMYYVSTLLCIILVLPTFQKKHIFLYSLWFIKIYMFGYIFLKVILISIWFCPLQNDYRTIREQYYNFLYHWSFITWILIFV